MASIARMERENFVERSLMGKRGAARAGRIPAGRPLYGYTKDDEGRPVADANEAIVVNRLFHEYANKRQGVPTIMKTLEAEYGFRRTAANAYLMLRNPAYIGRMTYDGVEIPCPAIVSQALWDQTQECLTKNLVRGAKGQHENRLPTTGTHYLRGMWSPPRRTNAQGEERADAALLPMPRLQPRM